MANVGSVDRALRIVLGVVLITFPLVLATASLSAGLGGWTWLLLAAGAVLVVTGVVRLCPAYALLGIRTCPSR